MIKEGYLIKADPVRTGPLVAWTQAVVTLHPALGEIVLLHVQEHHVTLSHAEGGTSTGEDSQREVKIRGQVRRGFGGGRQMITELESQFAVMVKSSLLSTNQSALTLFCLH